MRRRKRTPVRATTGRVREALFDIIRRRIEGARFLDLYAGTGAVGIEALRQGAGFVVFVDAATVNTRNIKKQVAGSKMQDRSQIITRRSITFIDAAESMQEQFDIIFLDPPYHTEEILNVMASIGRSELLSVNGVVVAEHFSKIHLPERFDKLHKIKDYKYGDSILSLYGYR